MLRAWEDRTSHLSCDAVISKVSYRVFPLLPKEKEDLDISPQKLSSVSCDGGPSCVTDKSVCVFLDAEDRDTEVTLHDGDASSSSTAEYNASVTPSEDCYIIIPVEFKKDTQDIKIGHGVRSPQKFSVMSLKSSELKNTIDEDHLSSDGSSSDIVCVNSGSSPENQIQAPMSSTGQKHCGAADDMSSSDASSGVPSRRSSCVSEKSESDSEKTFKCLLCNDEFGEQDSLHLHIAMAHGAPNNHQCQECGKIFTRLASLRSHTEWHLRKDERAFSQGDDASSGVRQSRSKSIKKPEISSEVPKTDIVVRNTTSQTPNKPHPSVNLFSMDDIHIGPLMCTFCKQTFKTQESLCTHVAANHALKDTSEKPGASKSKPKAAKDSLQCRSCSQTFNSQEGLDRHKVIVHSCTEFHTCDHCSSSFSSKSNLMKHVSSVHRKEHASPKPSVEKDMEPECSKLLCPICGKCFREATVFQSHLDSHDANTSSLKIQPRMKCDVCSTEFANVLMLEEHVAKQHSRSNSPRHPALLKARECSPMSRSSGSPPPRSPMSDVQVRAMQPCAICTEDGRKMHDASPEGSMSCTECAQFFVENLRLLIFVGKLKCDYKGKCLIARNTMESCPPCHLKLCIKTFPVLKKLEEKALSIKRLDAHLLDHVFSILSSQCLHQSNCKRFMQALNELEKDAGDKSASASKTVGSKVNTSAKSSTAVKSSASGTKEKTSSGTIAAKRSSISSVESLAPKKAKKTEQDESVVYINEEDDDVIYIGHEASEDDTLSLVKDTEGVLIGYEDSDTATPVQKPETSSTSSQEKPKPPQFKSVAKKRTFPAKKRRSSGSTDSESVAASIRSRTTSAEEDLKELADSAESLDRSGLGLDDHLVTLFSRMADWAKPLFWLWTLVPFNLRRLQEYNTKQAQIRPYCCICQLFVEDENTCPEPKEVPVQENVTFRMSEPTMPESLFRGKPHRVARNKKEPTPPICKEEPQGATVLVTCAICAVCVHAKCYGIDMDETLSDWKCAICRIEKFDAECCLCFLRGGALQSTTDGRWCHIVCALGVPDIFFIDVEARRPINVKAVSKDRKKLKCRHCSTWTKDMRRNGTCAQCWDSTRCCAPLHVTCGKAAGDFFKARHDDSRVPVYIICRRHNQKNKKPVRVKMPKVETGQQVTAKARNGRFYKATIKSQFMEIFYEVDFQDGSVSKDLYPEDILHRNCREYGPPPIGSNVEVLWTDKKVYPGIFKGVNNCIVFKVEFEDASVVKLKREEFYAVGESLPADVRKKLSTATPSKFNFDEVFAHAPTVPRARCSHYEF